MMWRKTPNSREELPEYVERSYHEALVNALAHRDYLVYGSEVHVIADLSDIAADSGSYTVPARIEVSGYDVGAVGTYEVTVHIS